LCGFGTGVLERVLEKVLKFKWKELTTNGQNIINGVSEYLTRYYEADQIKEMGSTSSIRSAYMDEMRNKCRFRVENQKDKNHFGEAAISVLKTKDEIKWNDSFNSGQDSDRTLRLL
jgi:hypothetical protein